MSEVIEYVARKEVSCDGGNGRLGHPKVYLHMKSDNQAICPYCSKKYVYKTENHS